MAFFPPDGLKEDSSMFSETTEDKSLKSETDGGYVYSRPRHGRKPRRTFSTGITFINEAQKASLVNFVNLHGSYLIFSYKIPDTEETVAVRFETLPKFNYVGAGGSHWYNVTDIELKEV